MIARKFRTKEAQKRERIRLTVKVVAIFAFAIISCIGLVYVSHMDTFRIQHVYVESNGIVENANIASVIESEFSKSFFGVLPKGSAALLSHSYLTQTIKHAFPRIDSVSIDRLDFSTLRIEVSEREPKALWCGDVVPPIAQEEISTKDEATYNLWGTCYLMDDESYIYAKAPVYSDNVFPKYYGSLDNADPVGQFYIDSTEFSAWQTFYLSIINENEYPVALLFVDERDAELYMSNGLKILIPREEHITTIQNRLRAVLESGNIDEERTVQYVDLRFGNKAFIKYEETVE